MSARTAPARPLDDLARLAALFVAYAAAGVAGLQWADAPSHDTPVWPAAGVGLAGLVLGGLRLWPAVFAGRLFAALATGSTLPLWVDAIVAGGHAAGGVLAAAALRRAGFDPRLGSLRDVLLLALGGAVGGAVIATLGTAALTAIPPSAGGLSAGAAALWTEWWLGTFVGVIAVAPLVMAWSSRGRPVRSRRDAAMLAAVLAATGAVSAVVFLGPGDPYMRTWLAYPVLVWAALALQVRGAAAAILVVSAAALWGAGAGTGPFAVLTPDPQGQILAAQQFSAIAGLVALVLAAVADERRGLDALRRSEARLEAVLESTADSVATIDRSWRFTYLNGRAQAQIGGGRDLLGTTLWEAFPEVAGTPFEHAYRDAAEHGRQTRAEAFYEPLGRWFEMDVYPSPDGLTVFFRDVTDQRRAADALTESEDRLRAVLEQMPVGVAVAAVPSGELLFHNARAIEILGHPLLASADHTGYARYGARHEDLTPYDPEEYPIARAVLRAETVEREPMLYRRGDGRQTRLEVSAAPIRDASGAVVLAVSTFEDVSERLAAEAALREGERRLRVAQTAADIATWELDLRTRSITWSGPADRLFGGPPPADLDTALRQLHDEDAQEVVRRVQEATDGGRPYEAEFRVVRPDGTVRWALGRGEVVRHASGRPIGLIGVNIDVTERRNAAEALARLNAELERRVEEGAARVAQLQKMESLGRLTGGIAHDFNNLLMAVIASLEPLKARLPADDRLSAQLADNAMQGAERGAALTRRLLAFARRREHKAEPVDVAALVDGMANLLRRSIGPRVQVDTELDRGAPPAMADPIQLEAAILNLAVNGRDAMSDGGSLTIRVDAPDPGSVRVTVTDTGAGMDADTLARAMEPFFTTKGVGEGTGLGLPMVQALADQAGGAFRLDSTPGAGTRAELTLPAARTAAAPAVPATGRRDVPAPAAAPLRGLSVLLVDDDPLVLMGAAAMLRDLGHRPTEAASGRHALDILRGGGRFDAVVTDQAMPGMTGLDLARAIRRMRPDLPVVLATGYAELPGDSRDLVSGRLGKPFRLRDLEAALARAAG
jgi:PAS domain S-box-containing protein